MKCFYTQDPDVHRESKLYCQAEPDTLKKVIYRLILRGLTPTHFSSQESSHNVFISQSHFFLVSKKEIK